MAYVADNTLLYDPTSQDLTPETWPLETLLQQYVQAGLRDLRIAFPAMVLAVDGEQTVDLQPLIKVRYAGQQPTDIKPLRGVPVVMPQGNDWRMSYPLAVGDTGLALITDRSLDAWLAGDGSSADPNDTRCHALADAVFVPGLVPTGLQTTDTGTDLVLQNGQSTVRLQKNGHIRFNNSQFELVDLLHKTTQAMIDTLTKLNSALVLTAFGPAPFTASSIADFTAIQTQLNQLLNDLDSFKS